MTYSHGFITTAFTTMADSAEDERRMTGGESWPIKGVNFGRGGRGQKLITEIIRRCAGLHYYWDCLEKAVIACEVLGSGYIGVGSTIVISSDNRSTYGFDYHPPLEFHAWVCMPKKSILDVALPGIIERGLKTNDCHGPLISGRRPIILAGKPPYWIRYKLKEKMTVEEYYDEKKKFQQKYLNGCN